MAQGRRVFQIAEKIRNVLAMELLNVADPRFHLVTLTSVVVTPDLRLAKVYWVVSGDAARRAAAAEAFESASNLFRRAVGKQLAIKFIPSFKFYYDDTLDASAEVDRLFARIHAESPKQDSIPTSHDDLTPDNSESENDGVNK